eukprot:m.139573 g.139573  ORF g.139573 m.139573 type:complete len:90 (+) comp24076_c0_seq4:1706-1975(+)
MLEVPMLIQHWEQGRAWQRMDEDIRQHDCDVLDQVINFELSDVQAQHQQLEQAGVNVMHGFHDERFKLVDIVVTLENGEQWKEEGEAEK